MNRDELLEKAKKGDKEAFGFLYKEYFNKIYRYCRANMYQEELASDVAQETFLRAWKSLPGFTQTENGTFQSYLFTIARNLIVDLSRKQRDIPLETLEEKAANDNVEEGYDRKEKNLTVKRALSLLNELDRQIIILRYFEELKYEDVAWLLGINAGALRVRTSRILKKLYNIIKKNK